MSTDPVEEPRASTTQPPEIIKPGPDAQEPIDVGAQFSRTKAKALNPTDRLEARVDRHIEDLRNDKASLQAQIADLREREIAALHDEVSRLKDRVASGTSEYARPEASYKWAIAFNSVSFALIAVGGATVSYASFVGLPDNAKRIADFAFAALMIGVLVQGVNSVLGTKALPK